ncbi:sigma factor [Microbispora sp. KK1-11]|uniref:sigma factor n=1 Tax=Microbispora sp. KK1-11 TaxID=2053005 RepID=UPI00115902EC|nr:sigma factor [Microbispora sp. KK1-11]TQS22511.1 hypothetical protein FLW16_38000 [Microbispora sp. KK1-11]
MSRSPGRNAEFTEYVTEKALWLRKVAYLLCGDWHAADDLVQATVTKLYTNWQRAGRADNVDAALDLRAALACLPLRIDGLPAGVRVQEVHLWRPPLRGAGAWELQLFLSANGLPVTVGVSPAGGSPQPRKSTCTSATGLDLCVQVDGPVPASLRAIGGPRGLLDRITVLGADERDWTTDVIG